ncbi:MAG: hypothetical protein R2710_00060 [Acidimicrobiales bacterium]
MGGADCTAQTQVPTIECNYLVALASATNSPGWTANSGWLAHSLPCLWPGVTCDATNVTGLADRACRFDTRRHRRLLRCRRSICLSTG